MSAEESPVVHDEAIGQFCGVTGASEERAKSLLEACDWNLELAINMHVDTDDNRRPTTSSRSGPSSENALTRQHSGSPEVISPPINDQSSSSTRDQHRESAPIIPGDDDVRPPIPPVRQVLVDSPMPSPSYSSSSARFAARSSHSVHAFRDFQAAAQWQEINQGLGDASSSDAAKRRTLEELFRPPLDLIFRGSLTSAREVGRHRNKWLLVNVQNVLEFSCQTLNRDVWSNQAVKDIVKEHFIFWQVYHDNADGARYIQFYQVKTFPYVAIVDPRTGEQMKTWPTTIDHNSFCDSVIEFLSDHPSPDGSGDASSMKKLRLKEDETTTTLYDQSEEAQLQAAIKASLQAAENSNHSYSNNDDDCGIETFDSETDVSQSPKFSASQSSNDASLGAVRSDLDNGERKEGESSRHQAGRSSHSENDNGQVTKKVARAEVEDYRQYLGSDQEKTCDLILRLPDGRRDQVKFPADSQLKALFLLLASYGYCIEDYNYVTNFPRRNLHELCDSKTLLDASLIRETIFVERKTKDN